MANTGVSLVLTQGMEETGEKKKKGLESGWEGSSWQFYAVAAKKQSHGLDPCVMVGGTVMPQMPHRWHR